MIEEPRISSTQTRFCNPLLSSQSLCQSLYSPKVEMGISKLRAEICLCDQRIHCFEEFDLFKSIKKCVNSFLKCVFHSWNNQLRLIFLGSSFLQKLHWLFLSYHISCQKLQRTLITAWKILGIKSKIQHPVCRLFSNFHQSINNYSLNSQTVKCEYVFWIVQKWY